MVSGLELANTRRRLLRIGKVRVRVYGETTPCSLMEEAHAGLRAALRPAWRGGVFAEVLDDGEIQEVYVAVRDGSVVGFVILVVKGAFVGYIRTIAVRADWRSRGLGRRLIWFAEERIFRDSPNVFICVSSFNERARALYERLGYELVGELRDYIVQGHSEWLLRKTLGPLAEFRREN